MRMFSLLGLLIALLIGGWMSATYLNALTTPPQQTAPIDRARELVSQDKERQERLQEALDQL